MCPVSPTARNTNILTPKEVSICKTVADLDIKLLSLRAQALLFIHEGYTQADTAAETGLSIGQVRYLMIIFKKKGINIFPKSLLDAVKTEKNAPAAKAAPPVEETPEETPVKQSAAAKRQTDTTVKKEKKKKKEKAKAKKAAKPAKVTKKPQKDKKKKGKKKKK